MTRRTDKPHMGAKWKKNRDLWKDWLDRDDRQCLVDLEEHKWSGPYTWKVFSPWLHSIVSSLHFGSQLSWGLQTSTKDIKILAFEFLAWLEEVKAWGELKHRWAHRTEGHFSIPFFMARAYLRFKAAAYPDWKNQASASGQRQLLELPDPHFHRETFSENTKWISSPILDAFASLTSRLAPEIRLIYQLHLEGLLNGEIAAVLQCEEKEVVAAISAAKGELNFDLKKGNL